MDLSKIMLGGKIDLTKIDKSVLFKSEKTGSVYLDIILFLNVEEADQYENNGAIIQSFPKEQRPEKALYLGNVRIITPAGEDVAEEPLSEKDLNDLPF